ncbi:sensor histidine kinase, partial [Oharaeibacter diazotrophicus]
MAAGRTATGGGGRGRADDPDRTAVVSHEIRGPLGVVAAVCDLLLGGGLDAEARRLVELVRLANAQALGVAEDLVAEASLGAGRFRVVPRPVDPAAVLRQVADLWAPMTAGGRHRLGIVVAPDVADLVITDEGRLRQILINLVSNATKASETGTVTLSLAAGADGVVFTVADRGPGLPAGFAPTPFADGGPDRAPASG